ncbi:MAG: DEAD/DEAH box helicase [Cryomorphaceae bacterium]|nr:DEAD/DEAH box helicase [Cryomorphaceae bacterium]
MKSTLSKISSSDEASALFRQANLLYLNGQVHVMSQSGHYFELDVEDVFDDFRVKLQLENEEVTKECSCKSITHCKHSIAGMMHAVEILGLMDFNQMPEGKAYTRKGMVKRVLKERQERADAAKYRIQFSENVYGPHELTNETEKKYTIAFRNFEKEDGHCSCSDYQTNKLGTCKHLMYAFKHLPKHKLKLSKSQRYPFIDIHLDPHNEYRISLFYPHDFPEEIQPLIHKFFGDKTWIESNEERRFLEFINRAEVFKQIHIRKEVLDKLENAFEHQLILNLQENTKLDFAKIKADLYPYQKEGVEFAVFRQGAIIADEMGLGKTLQAIATAVFKKEIFGFTSALVVCPASLKSQWKKEIERFSDETAIIVEGLAHEREAAYQDQNAYFKITNYEALLRDWYNLNKHGGIDFIILDEAQRIKNYETRTANVVKSIRKKHALVITGTPIENKLIDLYSIVEFIKPGMLAPLWEFSYQHCYFDKNIKNKITGYYNLQSLKDRLKSVLIRREKQDVIDQLNTVTQIDVPLEMHDLQKDYHASNARSVAQILAKRHKTPYDMQKLTRHLQIMRMACDSSYLVDQETHHSPKLDELKEILLEKLDLHNNNRKVIIFSEWKRMNGIIGKMLRDNQIGFAELNGSVPVKKRKHIIVEFESNENCQVFLSTEAGGSGLNLQVADTVINFELPWNPAKKNQRIGRIDRLGQQNKNLTVINLICKNSIEMTIASGLLVKQNLFESVLSPDNQEDVVDFSRQGRAQFLQQLEESMAEFSQADLPSTEVAESESVFEEMLPEEIEKKRVEVEAEARNQKQRLRELESVMQQGMQFLASMYKMSTGKELEGAGQNISVDEETGEVVMRFKL